MKRKTLFQNLFTGGIFGGTVAWLASRGWWSLVRLAGAVWDLLLSIAKYFLVILGFSSDFIPEHVKEIPDVPFVPFLPVDASQLSGFWGRFFSDLFSKEHFLRYNARFFIGVLSIQRFLLPVVVLFLVLKFWISGTADEENDDFGKKSKGVRRVEWLQRKIFFPVKSFLVSWWTSLRFWVILTLLLLFSAGLNVLTLLVEAVAFLFWFSVQIDFSFLYTGIYKLFLDLTIMFSTLPAIVWIFVAYLIFCFIRRAVAYRRLESMEAANRGFVEKLPLCVLITGKIGIGKTTTNVNLSLTLQDAMRERLLASMMEIQAEFPFFPWEFLDRQIGVMFCAGDLPSKSKTRKLFSDKLFSEDPEENGLFLFGYTGRMIFEDGVNVKHLENRLVDYAELQVMYRQQTLIFSSFSFRVDNLYTDLGKMPYWSSDFFRTPGFDPWSEPLRSHILDFDTLRLGKTVSREPGGAWEYGILSHTEMGKDFGNTLTNKDLKATDDAANIKNDMLIDRIKVLRHTGTADHHPYVQYIGDEQRPTSLGADALELCDVVRLVDASEKKKSIRLLLIEQFFVDLVNSIWSGWYVRRRVHRADEDLPTWFLRRTMNRLHSWEQRMTQLFGYQEISCVVQDGADLEKEGQSDVIFTCFKKVHSGRFSTDCFAGVLASRSLNSKWSIQTAPTYAGPVASPEEIRAQHSYFGNKVLKIGGEEDDESADGD
ncbi:MAG: hypothetical protein J5958_05495 [Clostridia bacterium]|nr:hypothetical protein [Clostridia bacterium]